MRGIASVGRIVVGSLVVFFTACGGAHRSAAPSTMIAAVDSSAAAATMAADTQLMTEDEEVAWVNAHGFHSTLDDLRASYATFRLERPSPNLDVLWDTETDELRNWLALWRRTQRPQFLDQARAWRDWVVETYSRRENGKHAVEKSHVYLAGIVEWAVAFSDEEARAAASRLLDFVLTVDARFVETRVSARIIEGLAAWIELMPDRRDEATAKLRAFLAGVDAATRVRGFVCMRFVTGERMGRDGLAKGDDLRALFPGDARAGLIDSAATYALKGHDGAGAYQDCMLMAGLQRAARALGDPRLATLAGEIANAWVPYVRAPRGESDLVVPYYVIPDAPEGELYIFRMNGTPVYVTQYAPFCPDPALRARLETQALLRGWGKKDPIAPSELGGKPKLWPWQTWERGYFLLRR